VLIVAPVVVATFVVVVAAFVVDVATFVVDGGVGGARQSR
jgi:hypothetical protein